MVCKLEAEVQLLTVSTPIIEPADEKQRQWTTKWPKRAAPCTDFRLWTSTTFCWYKVTWKRFSCMLLDLYASLLSPPPLSHLPPLFKIPLQFHIKSTTAGKVSKIRCYKVRENAWLTTRESTHVTPSDCSTNFPRCSLEKTIRQKPYKDLECISSFSRCSQPLAILVLSWYNSTERGVTAWDAPTTARLFHLRGLHSDLSCKSRKLSTIYKE